ncbi:MAG TPA: helix-turn-helix transcriptional regulator, partial [Streptosporangiaceae bacterium]|nr:helix-turn-helix transcriptional regulator [Streptosporangiaceae bacterium]
MDLQAGRTGDAAVHLREALEILIRVGDRVYLHNGLDRCGYLCAATGRWAEAITVWAAFAALLRHQETPDVPSDVRRREGPLRQALEALGPDRARAAEERGETMSLDTAAEYALMLTTPSPQPPAAAPSPGRLSVRERELVTLVAQGRTDAQIAAQLFISVRTVRSHLDR